MNVLTFAGAGTSVELGVPAMRAMVLRLTEHLHERQLAPALAEKLGELLKDAKYDMENLIEELDHMAAASGAFASWGVAGMGQVDGVTILRQEAEWFVTHVCERVESATAVRLWGPTIEALRRHRATIVTTNYDRAVEIAAARLRAPFYDGFQEFGADEWVPWEGFAARPDHILLKVHGSTDWYHSANDDQVWKLRHPMPLFGRVTMQVDAPHPLKLRSAAILPSREKKTNLHPYPDLSYEFCKSVDEADVAVFVGTSLRDPDMRNLYRRAAGRVPTFVVGRSAQVPEGTKGKAIRQTASKFFAATFPTALESVDPLGVLEAETKVTMPDDGILEDLVTATDEQRPHRARCDAIERLASAGVALPGATVTALLNDLHPEVRMFSLALVNASGARAALLEQAKAIAGAAKDSAFNEEFRLLELLARVP